MSSKVNPGLPADFKAATEESLAFMNGETSCGSPRDRTPTDQSVGLIAPIKDQRVGLNKIRK
jgi:hypothetical protein